MICGLVLPILEMTKVGSYRYFPALAGRAASSQGKNYTGGRGRTLPIITDGLDIYHNIKKKRRGERKELLLLVIVTENLTESFHHALIFTSREDLFCYLYKFGHPKGDVDVLIVLKVSFVCTDREI